jgi:hypothetical protein
MTSDRDTFRPRREPVRMSGIVDSVVGSLGLTQNYYGWLVVSQWPEIVGEHYARKSQAIRFSDGVLFIAVPDSSWRQMMAVDTDKILSIIRRYPYGSVIRELRLVWGKKGT